MFPGRASANAPLQSRPWRPSSRSPPSPTTTPSSSRSSTSGSGRAPSSSSGSGTGAARSGRSSTGRSRRTTRWPPTTAGAGRSRTSSSATRRVRGFDQRYQNGFDCQGLWVEVGVERALGLNSKQEIEEYGLAEFAERCKERVAEYSEVITEQSKRLGMWMDWDNDYYTFSDTNIEYIWRFLKTVHERGWLYLGHRSTEWCPRCGTSLSQHELINSYEEITHPSLFVRFPLKERTGESLVIWTTTPWTLPANVAAAVKPDAEYGLRENGDWVAVARYPGEEFARTVRGEELVGLEYEGPFDYLPAQAEVVHRVIPWDEVSLEEGTGIVHIAPGAGSEDFELSKVHDLPVLAPIDEAGRFYADYGEFEGRSTEEVEKPVIVELDRRGRIVEHGSIVHRYPVCWRCATPLVFRIADDWLISCDEVREQMLAANADRRVDARLLLEADGRLAPEHGRLEHLAPSLLRPAASVLSVRVRKAERRRVAGRAARARDRRSRPAPGAPSPVGRRGHDRLRVVQPRRAARGGGRRRVARRRHRPLRDARLAERRVERRRLRDRSVRRALRRRPPRPRVLGEVVPGRLGLGDARADQALVLLAVVHVRDADRKVAVQLRPDVREAARRERPGDAPARGATPSMPPRRSTTWARTSCACSSARRSRARTSGSATGRRERSSVGCSRSGTPSRSSSPTPTSRAIGPSYADLEAGPQTEELRTLDRWLVARTQQLVEETTTAYESFWTPGVTRAFDAFVDDLSNWYIRRSRRRFYEYDDAAFRTLWYALVQSLRVIAPVMPFLAEHLWRNLVAEPCEDAPRSIFLRLVARDRAAAERSARGGRGGSPRRRARPASAIDVGAQASPTAAAARRAGHDARRRPHGRGRGGAARQGPSSSATSTRPSCS